MEIFPMNMQVLDARRDVSGGYKVDVTRGERVAPLMHSKFRRSPNVNAARLVVPSTLFFKESLGEARRASLQNLCFIEIFCSLLQGR
jgi:hypothetical protein